MSRYIRRNIGEGSTLVSIIRNKWLQSGIAGIPFAGGPAQAFLSNVVHEIDQKNWNIYWESVESCIEDLQKEKIDIEYFSSEDFLKRIRQIYREVVTGTDKTKLVYLRNYLLASASTQELDATWKDIFFDHLKSMTGSHLIILRFFYNTQNSLSLRDRFQLKQRIANSPIILESVCKEIESADKILVEMLVADLCARGLLALWLGDELMPRGWSITDSGLRLMRFLLVFQADETA
ncbi:hypothetical protein [Roseospirillum parvum]|uniref:Uncharacterized protein n=1 Tax=Roseospirillum parvum TaxID=83401 RepID=A0A1G8B287_9PROT|nr:hypothetical protein [Roseospirillum parvum]SDH27372.1 hypothetical protein SAMN05421742_105187 [Roseospirillum parvum]